jgi:hypothetical protein
MIIKNPLLHKIYMAELKNYLPKFDSNSNYFVNATNEYIINMKESLIFRINNEESDEIDLTLFDWNNSIIHNFFWFELEIMLKLTNLSFIDYWNNCQTIEDIIYSFKTHYQKSITHMIQYLPNDFIDAIEKNLKKIYESSSTT